METAKWGGGKKREEEEEKAETGEKRGGRATRRQKRFDAAVSPPVGRLRRAVSVWRDDISR